MDQMADLRERMVHEQLMERGIQDAAVLGAMRAVPRELFVPAEYRQQAYADSALPIEAGQTISQPYIVAWMLQLLKLAPGDRVLEVGTGSGYAAAVLSRIVSLVYTVERYPELARSAQERFEKLAYRNIHVKIANGTRGWPEHAPYNAISMAAGAPEVPKTLLGQLGVGGRFVGPIGMTPNTQVLMRIERSGENEYRQERHGEVRFVPLIGAEGWPESDKKDHETRSGYGKL